MKLLLISGLEKAGNDKHHFSGKSVLEAVHPSMREGKWKLHLHKKSEPELYDLSIDPTESHSLASEHPNVLQSMIEKLKSWSAELPQTYVKEEKLEIKKKSKKKKA